jgi:NCS1 family nucleobase:cation symporter-1
VWWQALIVIIVSALLSTLFIVLNSLPGAFYHLGFPIANRYVWGMYGSYFVIYNRILLSLVWYAVQAWIGGQCIYVCLQAIWTDIEQRIPNHMSPSTGMTTAQFVAYIIFSVISLPLIWIRPHKLKFFFYISVTIVLIFEISLLIWALATMGPKGFGDTLSSRPQVQDTSVGWAMVYGIVSCIGGISAGILNQNDYARFTKRPRYAITGQIVSAPTYTILSAVVGILVTAATQERYGEALWNLPTLLSRVIETGGPRSRAAAFFAGAALVVSQFGINIPGNALSGGFDFAAVSRAVNKLPIWQLIH